MNPGKKKLFIIFIILLIIFIPALALISLDYYPKIPKNPQFKRGITYVPFSSDLLLDEDEYKNIDHMLSIGADWVALVPIWYQKNYTSTEIMSNYEDTPSDKSIREAIEYFHDKGKKVMLKPYIDSLDEVWRAEFQPTNWTEWFKSYQNFIWHFSEIAEDENVEIFCVGCEYISSDEDRYLNWSKTIEGIRGRYSGKLTYAADWTNYDSVCFWDLLDYIGIDAYFPLSEKNNPSFSDLINGWNDALDNIEKWLKDEFNSEKEVIFTEVGYESQPKCWQNPAATESEESDVYAQNMCYKALFATIPDRSWLGGMFIWWWDNPSTDDADGGLDDIGFTPKGKPAEFTISLYYNIIADRIVFPISTSIFCVIIIGIIILILRRKNIE
ncbi:MAG: glycoside hydrolase family 113 [Promethearchaeia archaeon]